MKTFQTCDTTFVPAGSELKASPGRTQMRASAALLRVCRKGRGNAVCRKRLSLVSCSRWPAGTEFRILFVPFSS